MNYTAPKDTIYTITKYEKEKLGRLRKISILKNLPFEEWTSSEYADLETNYFIYININGYDKNDLSITKFLHNGLYESHSEYEELKSNTLDPVKPNMHRKKRLKLKI